MIRWLPLLSSLLLAASAARAEEARPWWTRHGIEPARAPGQAATFSDLEKFMTAFQEALAEVSDGYANELADQWKRDGIQPPPGEPTRPCGHFFLRKALAPVHELLAEAAPDWHARQLGTSPRVSLSIPVYPWPDVPPLARPATLAELQNAFSIDPRGLRQASRLRSVRGLVRPAQFLTRQLDELLVGKQGGERAMAVFSHYDHSRGEYRRNEHLWCRELGRQLTGLAVYKGPGTGTWDSYGGTMITPRHILFCNHAHPHPAGSPKWPNGLGQRLRFVDAAGNTVERTLVHGLRVPDKDLWIGLIDRPLPESIAVYRLSPHIPGMTGPGRFPWQAPEIGFSQGTGRLTPEASFAKWPGRSTASRPTHYGTVGGTEGAETFRQPPMIYLTSPAGNDDSHPLRKTLSYRVWDGDSGTPRFRLANRELLLTRIVSGAYVAGQGPTLDETIAAVDASAVQAGIIGRPTGLKTSTATPAELHYRRPPDAPPALPGTSASRSAPATPAGVRKPRPRVVLPPRPRAIPTPEK